MSLCNNVRREALTPRFVVLVEVEEEEEEDDVVVVFTVENREEKGFELNWAIERPVAQRSVKTDAAFMVFA